MSQRSIVFPQWVFCLAGPSVPVTHHYLSDNAPCTGFHIRLFHIYILFIILYSKAIWAFWNHCYLPLFFIFIFFHILNCFEHFETIVTPQIMPADVLCCSSYFSFFSWPSSYIWYLKQIKKSEAILSSFIMSVSEIHWSCLVDIFLRSPSYSVPQCPTMWLQFQWKFQVDLQLKPRVWLMPARENGRDPLKI